MTKTNLYQKTIFKKFKDFKSFWNQAKTAFLHATLNSKDKINAYWYAWKVYDTWKLRRYWGPEEAFYSALYSRLATRFQELKRREDLYQKLFPKITLQADKLVNIKTTETTTPSKEVVKGIKKGMLTDKRWDSENKDLAQIKSQSRAKPISAIDLIAQEYGIENRADWLQTELETAYGIRQKEGERIKFNPNWATGKGHSHDKTHLNEDNVKTFGQGKKITTNRYRCKNTGKYFNVKSTTIFRNSKIPLRIWFYALYKLAINKKGISSHQLAKDIGITQKSAWFVLHRLRYTFKSPIFETVLDGVIEIDETFIGGRNKNRHWDKKVPHSQGRSWKDKVPVLGIIERNGNLITKVIPNTKQNTIEPIIKEHVKENADVYTDEWFAYKDLGKWYNHEIVNHRIKQYVNGKVSVNSMESAWAPFKRSIYGIYHWVSKEHLPKYVDEFTFRFNTRKHKVQETVELILLSSVGKRLTYGELVN